MSKVNKTVRPQLTQSVSEQFNKSVKADNVKRAKRDFTAHLTRGASGANLSMTIEFGADVDRAIASLPKQCRLMCQYLVHHNDVATFQQLNDYADKADGVEFWGKGSTPYEQSVAKIASHYMPKLLGEVAWSKKLGKLEVIRLA